MFRAWAIINGVDALAVQVTTSGEGTPDIFVSHEQATDKKDDVVIDLVATLESDLERDRRAPGAKRLPRKGSRK